MLIASCFQCRHEAFGFRDRADSYPSRHTPTAHDIRFLDWLERQDFTNDQRIRPLWLAAKVLLFNERAELRELLCAIPVRHVMAQIHIPTLLRPFKEQLLRGEEIVDPIAEEMVEWYRGTLSTGVQVPLMM